MEAIENLIVTRVVDLSYRMGLLSRPEWCRVRRCYDIRKDLEHKLLGFGAGAIPPSRGGMGC